MRFLQLLLLTLLVALPGRSELFRVGVKGGVPLTDVVKAAESPASAPDYVVGPVVELRLPFGFGVEGDALYRRVSGPGGDKSSSWEFPILGKYRMGPGPVQPFLAGGFSFNRSEVLRAIRRGSDVASGWVAGVGLELGAPILHFTAEGRYTRWYSDVGSTGAPLDNRNQFQVLVGITF
jgi:hypothetical protein